MTKAKTKEAPLTTPTSHKVTLYELDKQFDALFTVLLDPEMEQSVFDEQWNSLERTFTEKLLACNYVCKHWDAAMALIKQEEARLAAKRKQVDRARNHVLGRIKGILQKIEDHKFEDKTYGTGFRLQKNSRPSVDVKDVNALREQYPEFVNVEVVTSVDKAAIEQHYKDTGEIPEGVEITEGTHVRVI